MRLTLRTLLAHLDRTLDPEDDAAIAAKLRESEFASKLADRVRACLESDALEAPSTLATGTADDPNRIGEYLDSVLSSEQVAEVERICLESDAHLAEVAACHQILTLVLAKPAEVPVPLRTKLYELRRDSHPEEGGSNGTFARPVTPLVTEVAENETLISPAVTQAVTPVAAPPISPVGPDDSGVSNAPTRLKDFAASQSAAGAAEPALAGSKKLSTADLADFTGRPSRVAPWLVVLGLMAAFLFVATQAFAPLLQRQAAENDRFETLSDASPASQADQQQVAAEGTRTSDLPPDTVPPAVAPAAGNTGVDADVAAESDPDSVLTPRDTATPSGESGDPPAVVEVAPAVPLPTDETATVDASTADQPGRASVAGAPAVSEVMDPDAPPATAAASASESMPAGAVATPSDMAAGPAAPRDAADVDTEPSNATDLDAAPLDAAPLDAAPLDAAPLDAAGLDPAGRDSGDPVEDVAPIVITSEGSLLLVRDPESDAWLLGGIDKIIETGSELICPPLYRDRLSVHEEVELTMVGPARVSLHQAPARSIELALEYGRFLLTGIGEQRQVSIRFEDTDSVLTLPSPESVVAIEVVSLRPPGLDPEDETSTRRVLQVLAAQGLPRWRSGNRPEVTLETGQLLTLGSGNEVSLSDARSVPPWLDEPVQAVASIESSARDGLLALVRGNEAVELSLREAVDFRRAEVGALAARTLLLLDRHDVYFGADGIFSQSRQRTYWPDHFNAVLEFINQGPEHAAAVRESIERMDAAQADEIYRLLWLFSDNQLAAGADELLVQSLDDSNMTIRVLAAENLRHITGNTLLYKPETETSSRRASDIKKWETRLRRGEIRWSTPPRAVAEEGAAVDRPQEEVR